MSLRRVLFQPDYFMSAQFAGLAVALDGGAYARRALDVEVLPLAGAGEIASEIGVVSRASEELIVGSTEQNILIPAQFAGAPVRAVAAMFGASPLCLAALPAGQSNTNRNKEGRPMVVVGAHEDTVDLLRRLLPSGAEVVTGGTVFMGPIRAAPACVPSYFI